MRAVDACRDKLLAHGFRIMREQQISLTADEAGEYLGVAPANAAELAKYDPVLRHQSLFPRLSCTFMTIPRKR